MLCCRLPDVAVTVAVYVPGGVPGVVCADGEVAPPPQPISTAIASTVRGVAGDIRPFSLRKKNNPEAKKAVMHASGIPAAANL